MLTKFVSTFVLLAVLTTTSSFAQSYVLCLNSKTKALTVRPRCLTATETIATGKTFAAATTSGYSSSSASTTSKIDLSKCYTASANKSGSFFNGELSVGVFCSKSTDILLDEQMTTSDSTGALPVLVSKRVSASSAKYPNGLDVTYRSAGGNNKFYTVNLVAYCCAVGQ